jgi:hypothetical protein
VRPLPGELVSEIEELFSHWMSHKEVRLPAAALLALWTHAVSAARQGSTDEPNRIAAFLTGQIRLHDERYSEMPAPRAAPGEDQPPGYHAVDPQLRQMISATARWCTRADPGIIPTLPRAAGPRTVLAVARSLVSQPEAPDWIYRGAENTAETHLVTIEMSDGSRRVLRDHDVRTGDLRWGYTGTGAHNLAAVLLADVLDTHCDCPDCMGVIPVAAGIIKCRSCRNSGKRHGTWKAERDLLIKVVAQLPEEFERTRLEFMHAIAGLS